MKKGFKKCGGIVFTAVCIASLSLSSCNQEAAESKSDETEQSTGMMINDENNATKEEILKQLGQPKSVEELKGGVSILKYKGDKKGLLENLYYFNSKQRMMYEEKVYDIDEIGPVVTELNNSFEAPEAYKWAFTEKSTKVRRTIEMVIADDEKTFLLRTY